MKALSKQRSPSDKRRQKMKTLSEQGQPSDKKRQENNSPVRFLVNFARGIMKMEKASQSSKGKNKNIIKSKDKIHTYL
ncbi:hypothetical protein COJ85_07510 [Bacillus sp. AFS076308]|nr:hypothetical protein COJ85_07510 [Bacillus sp. AFS076308]